MTVCSNATQLTTLWEARLHVLGIGLVTMTAIVTMAATLTSSTQPNTTYLSTDPLLCVRNVFVLLICIAIVVGNANQNVRRII